MTLKEKIDEVRDGIFHCTFGECETCPYAVGHDEGEDCSQSLLLDVESVISGLEEQIFQIEGLCSLTDIWGF